MLQRHDRNAGTEKMPVVLSLSLAPQAMVFRAEAKGPDSLPVIDRFQVVPAMVPWLTEDKRSYSLLVKQDTGLPPVINEISQTKFSYVVRFAVMLSHGHKTSSAMDGFAQHFSEPSVNGFSLRPSSDKGKRRHM